MRIEEIAALNWRDTSGQEELAGLVETTLESVGAPGISTSDLMQKLGAKTKDYKGLADQLGHFRRDNPEYVTKGDKLGQYGKPSYRWHAPIAKVELTPEQRKAWMKANDPETYAALYEPK